MINIKRYPLLSAQLAIYSEWQFNPLSLNYNLPFIFRLPLSVQEELLESAIITLSKIHPVLLTRYMLTDEGDICQYVDEQSLHIEKTHTTERELKSLRTTLVKPFDLLNELPVRFNIITTEAYIYLFYDIHHISFDGVSFYILTAELERFLQGKEMQGETLSLFQTSIIEQQLRQTDALQRDLDYFDNLLSGATVATLPNKKQVSQHEIQVIHTKIDIQKVKKFCVEQGVTINSLCLSALSICLSRYARENTVSLSVVNHGRKTKDLKNTIGMFVRTMPIAFTIDGSQNIVAYIRDNNDLMREHYKHQTASLSEVLKHTGFDIGLIYSYQKNVLESWDYALSSERLYQNDPIYDIIIEIYENEELLEIRLEYDKGIYDENNMLIFSNIYQSSLQNIINNPLKTCADIDILNNEEQQNLLSLGYGGELKYEREVTMVDVFNRNVKEYPQKVAVVAENGIFTYQELDRQSDQLAVELIKQGVTQDSFVAIMLPRVKEFLLGTIAVFKSGGAYLPLDSEYPNDRLLYMLDDSLAKVLITTRALFEQKQAEGDFHTNHIIFIDEFDFACDNRHPVNLSSPDSVAYMIYTSGSTGKPKGVLIRHFSLLAFLSAWKGETYEMFPADRACCHSSFSFDASIIDLFASVYSAATIYVIPTDLRHDMPGLAQYINSNRLTIGFFTTQFGMELLNQFDLDLRLILLGGEKMNPVRACRFPIVNLYGPTEFTVCSVAYTVNQTKDTDNIPIGRPLQNTWAYVVDENSKLVPKGIAGELCMSGRQIAKGYWNRPELTAEKFSTNPYSTCEDNDKMYHTGDLVRWTEEGTLEYLGRIDNQVKLRGFRIELGEIESMICQFPHIASALVEVKEIGGVQLLCAYYTAQASINSDELRSYLSTVLTEYMIPAVYLQLEKFPMTPIGKINRAALPIPEIKKEEIVGPRNQKEQQLFDIIAELFQTTSFGVTTNLISLGMTSIFAIKLSILFQKKLQLKISSKDILIHPSICELLALTDIEATENVKIYERRAFYPLTENQRGLYIEWEQHRDGLQYNIPICLKFPKLDSLKLKHALEVVLAAHPYLKVRLAAQPNGEVVQLRQDNAALPVSIEILKDEPQAEFFQQRVRTFNLLEDALCRMEIYETASNTYLFIDFHHIIFDGISFNILNKELSKAYHGEHLAIESVTAFDRALDEEELLNSDKYIEAEQYFDHLLEGTLSTTLSNASKSDEKGHLMKSGTIISNQRISQYCREHAVTENVFFLTVFMQIINRFSNEENVQITTISNGREGVSMEHIMGMFVKTLPVVYKEQKVTAAEAMKQIQHQLFETIKREFYPFTTLVSRNNVHPLINYVYEGGIDIEFSLNGYSGEMIPVTLNTPKFPLGVIVTPHLDNYLLSIEYDDSCYTESYILQLRNSMCTLIDQIILNESAAITELTVISAEEQQKLLSWGYGGELECEKEITLIDVFNRHVHEYPAKAAVAAENGILTYLELDKQSDLLATELIKLGVTQDSFVGIMLPRVKEFLLCTIAVFKSGGAYLPLDSEYPNDRLLYMLEDSRTKVLITTRALFEQKQSEGDFNVAHIIIIDEFDFTGEKSFQPVNQSQPESLAYMIYTSGSTGQPKGVMIRHSSLFAYLNAWKGEAFEVFPTDHISCHSSFSFDASVIDLFGSVYYGATVYIIPTVLRQDLTGLAQFLNKNKITAGIYTTQLGMELLNQFDLNMRLILLGGEKMNSVRDCDITIVNAYGPTEFTVCSTAHTVNQQVDKDNIPIGRPLHNSWCYVMDKNSKLVPPGIAGELCLSGRQLAKGYWNRPELTAEKFTNNPFSTCADNAKMYHTGDLTRWNDQGELEYLGRIDNQVKLRGFRIELGEIETQISKYPDITSVVVEIKEVGGGQHLCAYYSAKNLISKEELRTFLAASLTEYMVPTVYIQLENMPLTPGGKINRKGLPLPTIERVFTYVAPTTYLESAICRIFEQLMNCEKVGVMDDFFVIGGTSMLAIRAIIQINNLGCQIQYGDLFKWKTPKIIASHLELKNSEKDNINNEKFFDLGDYDYTTIDNVLSNNICAIDETIETHSIGNVLLTGATGYLGAHVLYELIKKGKDKIYCLLRPSEDIEIDVRLKIILMYYFDNTFEDLFGSRIIPLSGDITDMESLINTSQYPIDTVINCAAVVKHYEVGNELEHVNYEGVLNLIELCRLYHIELIHVSTYSTSGQVRQDKPMITKEFDESVLYIGQTTDNKYILTKFNAERAILQAVSQGLRAKIMRVGNLMGRNSDGEFQTNFGSNAFVNQLKAYKVMGVFPLNQIIYPVEISPIDKVAEAIILLSQTPDNMVLFHPYNNFKINMSILINALRECGFKMDVVSDNTFDECFKRMMHDTKRSIYLSGILHFGNLKNVQGVILNNDFTTLMLYHLGFTWPLTARSYARQLISKLDGLGFFDEK